MCIRDRKLKSAEPFVRAQCFIPKHTQLSKRSSLQKELREPYARRMPPGGLPKCVLSMPQDGLIVTGQCIPTTLMLEG
eukprot:743652-Prorocentrum_lima.AAC.1